MSLGDRFKAEAYEEAASGFSEVKVGSGASNDAFVGLVLEVG